MSPWVNFAAIIAAQLAFFLFLAYHKRLIIKVTPKIVITCVLLGLVSGVAFDLLAGKYLGIFDYVLHFEPFFLILNGSLSYGLFFLTVYLLQSERFLSFWMWTIIIGLVYEVANYFYPVWIWTFGGSFLYQEVVVIFAAYCGLTMLAAIVSSLVGQTQFRAFRIKLK